MSLQWGQEVFNRLWSIRWFIWPSYSLFISPKIALHSHWCCVLISTSRLPRATWFLALATCCNCHNTIYACFVANTVWRVFKCKCFNTIVSYLSKLNKNSLTSSKCNAALCPATVNVSALPSTSSRGGYTPLNTASVHQCTFPTE